MRTRLGIFCLLLLIGAAVAYAEQRPIDTGKSKLTVRVYKAGVFGGLGHDHLIAAPIKSGGVDTSSHTVELRLTAASLKVEDPGASGKDREEIQKTMVGPEVLDIEHYPDIVFRSTSAESVGDGVWRVRGDLNIHGQSGPVELEVREDGGHYRGSALLKQSEFGIKPIKIAGGTIRVKDEIRIEFDIQLAR